MIHANTLLFITLAVFPIKALAFPEMKSSVYDKDEVEERKRNQEEQPYVSSDEELEAELRRRVLESPMQAAAFTISTEMSTSVDPSTEVSFVPTEEYEPSVTLVVESLVPDEVEDEIQPVVETGMGLIGSEDGGLLDRK